MSNSPNWLQTTPQWVWLSLIPTFGGLAIAYAGRKTNTNAWIALGLGTTTAAIVLYSTPLGSLVWLFQVGTALFLKKRYLLKTLPKSAMLPDDAESIKLLAQAKGKVDINECSKDDLVYRLGLPIVYANDIDYVRNQGYVFTDLEELSEIAGIPENYLRKIAPLILFAYYSKKDSDLTWRRLNTLSIDELVIHGLPASVAQKIIIERDNRGAYQSVIEISRRTGLPLSAYKQVI
jgi:DNA uptake protein ComE-like DNA-binding protein